MQGLASALAGILGNGNTEDSQKAVACEFVHHATAIDHLTDKPLHALIEPVQRFCCRGLLCNRAESHDISEEHRHLEVAAWKAAFLQ